MMLKDSNKRAGYERQPVLCGVLIDVRKGRTLNIYVLQHHIVDLSARITWQCKAKQAAESSQPLAKIRVQSNAVLET
jgi:hypothetical protein